MQKIAGISPVDSAAISYLQYSALIDVERRMDDVLRGYTGCAPTQSGRVAVQRLRSWFTRLPPDSSHGSGNSYTKRGVELLFSLYRKRGGRRFNRVFRKTAF